MEKTSVDQILATINDYILPLLDDPDAATIDFQDEKVVRVRGTRHFRLYDEKFQFVDEHPCLVRLKKSRRGGVESLRDYYRRRKELGNLARGMKSSLQRRRDKIDPFIEPTVRLVAQANEVSVSAGVPERVDTKMVRRHLASSSGIGTKLLFLHGNAGSGKSSLLVEVALEQAKDFLSNRADRLFLYVDAQGCNLRTLQQQISFQLDIYGGSLRFNEVVPLLRLGIISLIIDGFDELVMPSGYSDTTGALAGYLQEVKGEGIILASARSGFFYSYDLASVYDEVRYPVEEIVLEMNPWGVKERKEYARAIGELEKLKLLEQVLREAEEPTKELLSRPFVVGRILRLPLEGSSLSAGQCVRVIEEEFLKREAEEKLLSTKESRPLLTPEQLSGLLIEIALEMWRLEQTVIDLDTLLQVVEFTLEESGVGETDRKVIANKMESNPLLSVAGGSGKNVSLQFPHEMFFGRFLARGLIRGIERGSSVGRSLLEKNMVPPSVVEQVRWLLEEGDDGKGWNEGVVRVLFRGLEELGARASAADPRLRTLRRNIGQIAIEGLKAWRGEGSVKVVNAFFEKATFRGARLDGVTFEGCEFWDIDARGCDWGGAGFVNCGEINRLVVEDEQRFPRELPRVAWLVVVRSDGFEEEVFGFEETRKRLFREEEGLRASPWEQASENALAVRELVRRLCRRALRTFWFCERPEDCDDRGLRSMKADPNWRIVLETLERHGLLRREMRERRGVNSEMIHIERAGEILTASGGEREEVDGRIRAFWEEVLRM